MVKEEKKNSRRRSNRERAKRRKELVREEKLEGQKYKGENSWRKWGRQSVLTVIFATALIFICFVGQDPPSLRTLGEVAPENVYADRSFKFLSEVRRREAEEWIRSSTPREFAQNFAGEEAFTKALIRLQDGLLAIATLSELDKDQANQSLIKEIESNFNLTIETEEIPLLQKWRDFPDGVDLFSEISRKLRTLHLRGVVKYPSNDQKFISEANATREIETSMIELASKIVILSDLEDGLRFTIDTESLTDNYPYLSKNLSEIKLLLEEGGPFPEGGIQLNDIILSADDNASFDA
ncbi:MAG: hypothetical protein CBC16_10495, partial [Verrucomicrobia bacterium TMED56]